MNTINDNPGAGIGGDGVRNADTAVVAGFGEEWTKFDHAEFSGAEFERLFASYFDIFPWQSLPAGASGFDLGCGSGRWARGVAPRVGTLYCVDASDAALQVARRNLAQSANVEFVHASVGDLPFAARSMDFAYSLGVLHHVPDTAAGIREVAARLKPGAPFLLYLYYALDNKPAWYRLLHRCSELVRWAIARCPFRLRYLLSQLIAATVYWPLARLSRWLERRGRNVAGMPLSFYRNCDFYTMRTDALDRFGTRLEQRFSRAQIADMMSRAGLTRIQFSELPPFWTAVGFKS